MARDESSASAAWAGFAEGTREFYAPLFAILAWMTAIARVPKDLKDLHARAQRRDERIMDLQTELNRLWSKTMNEVAAMRDQVTTERETAVENALDLAMLDRRRLEAEVDRLRRIVEAQLPAPSTDREGREAL